MDSSKWVSISFACICIAQLTYSLIYSYISYRIMSTPAVSAVIRRRKADGGGEDGEGIAKGGIVLTASHNPGGPGEDFGIKYNEGLGQPAGEEFTDALYDKTLEISSYKSLNSPDIDLSASIGTQYQLTSTSTVTIIDPFEIYLNTLKSCFDFDQLRKFGAKEGFSMLFDGMHGAGGPFAKRVLIDELGLPESTVMRCNPLSDFGGCHPDPNLTYASELVKKMGLLPDGSADTSLDILLTFFLKPDVPGFIPSIGAVEIVTTSFAVSVLLMAINEEDIVLSPPREENMVS